MLELIDETLASVVEEETTDTTEGLSGQELDFGIWVLGVDETSRVNLDLLEIDGAGSDRHGEFLAVTSAVVTVCGGEVVVFGTVLLEERVGGEVGSVPTSGKDDRAVFALGLSGMLVLNTLDGARLILDELGDAGLLDDPDALGVAHGEILKALHLGVCDDLINDCGRSERR